MQQRSSCSRKALGGLISVGFGGVWWVLVGSGAIQQRFLFLKTPKDTPGTAVADAMSLRRLK